MNMDEEGNENITKTLNTEAPIGSPSLYNIATSIVKIVKRFW